MRRHEPEMLAVGGVSVNDGGGALGAAPVKRSLFADPEPSDVIAPCVALLVSAHATSDGGALGWLSRYSAAAPATCGDDIDVPLRVVHESSLSSHDDTMYKPGAKMSTHRP